MERPEAPDEKDKERASGPQDLRKASDQERLTEPQQEVAQASQPALELFLFFVDSISLSIRPAVSSSSDDVISLCHLYTYILGTEEGLIRFSSVSPHI